MLDEAFGEVDVPPMIQGQTSQLESGWLDEFRPKVPESMESCSTGSQLRCCIVTKTHEMETTISTEGSECYQIELIRDGNGSKPPQQVATLFVVKHELDIHINNVLHPLSTIDLSSYFNKSMLQ